MDGDLAAHTLPLARTEAALAADDLFARLARLRAAIPGRMVLTTGFGMEGQAITHAVFAQDLDIDVVTLDTGRLFQETHALWAATEARYGRRISGFLPETAAVETLLATQGTDGFRASVAARQACCGVRKVASLDRALDGAAVWITGLRAGQSAARAAVAPIVRDAARGVLKASPLHDWTTQDVAAFNAAHGVPVNALHAQGYSSIGCAPCTRAIAPGEDERAGRWWWEAATAPKECGLHVGADGRLVRAAAR